MSEAEFVEGLPIVEGSMTLNGNFLSYCIEDECNGPEMMSVKSLMLFHPHDILETLWRNKDLVRQGILTIRIAFQRLPPLS